MAVNSDKTGEESSTSLEGYIFPVDPTDPSDCFNRTYDDYLGTRLLMTQIDGNLYPLHLCGDTNTGMNWYGCSHGEVNAVTSGCEWTRTGETLTAQACVLDECEGYVLDTTKNPYVLVAEIDGQWYIVNVISADGLPDTENMGYLSCDSCCDVGVGTLLATISGCGDFDGKSFLMYSAAGVWAGSTTANGETFTFSLMCSTNIPDSENWTASGGCTTQAAPDSLAVTCSAATGTGTGTGISGDGKMSGSATFSPPSCAACPSGTITVDFQSIDGRPRDLCRTITRTGVEVTAEACGLDNLNVGDEVIMAYVPKFGISPTGTGTGTSMESQYHIIQVCRGEGECQPCDPPPPGDPTECCDLGEDDVPETLTGTMSISSAVDGCNCSSKSISFVYQEGTDPPEWHQVGVIDCEDSTGTSVSLSDISGMVITCSGEASGTGTGTGTGVSGDFFLTPPGCLGGEAFQSDSGQCEPLGMSWSNIDIQGCCGPILDPDAVDLPVYLSVEVAE